MPVEKPQPPPSPLPAFPEGRPPALRDKAFWDHATRPLVLFLHRWRKWSEIHAKLIGEDQHARELYQHGLAYLKLNEIITYDPPSDSWGPFGTACTVQPRPLPPPPPKGRPPGPKGKKKKKTVSEA